jgi:hypothetical protein
MAKYKVLDGSHVVSNEPLEVVGKGSIVESAVDLVAKFGDNKFQLVAADSEVAPQEGESKKGAKAK